MENAKFAGIILMLIGLFAFVWSGEAWLVPKFLIFLAGLIMYFASDRLARYQEPKLPEAIKSPQSDPKE